MLGPAANDVQTSHKESCFSSVAFMTIRFRSIARRSRRSARFSRASSPNAPSSDIDKLTEKLHNPFDHGFRTILYVARKSRRKVNGFAILLHEPTIGFTFLEYMAIGKACPGRGIGAALVRTIARRIGFLGAKGLFFECLPEDKDRCADPALRKQNASRLKFYESYGARPIIGTKYESPVPDGSSDSLPHLVYDDLDTDQPLKAKLSAASDSSDSGTQVRRHLSTVLYPGGRRQCRSDPVPLRPFRYSQAEPEHKPATRSAQNRSRS